MYNGIAFQLKLYHIDRENVLVTMEYGGVMRHCGTMALWHCGTVALRKRVQGLNLGRGGLDGSERQGFMLRQNAV